MTKQQINDLLNRSIGEKGNLHISSYWMKRILMNIMDWAETLTPKVNVPKKISDLQDDIGVVDVNYLSSEINSAINNSKTYADNLVNSAITTKLNTNI